MTHEKLMDTDPEYARIYRFMKAHNISLYKVLDVVVKANGFVGVGIVSLKESLDNHLDEMIKK